MFGFVFDTCHGTLIYMLHQHKFMHVLCKIKIF